HSSSLYPRRSLMNPLRTTLALGALASALLIATPAFPATDYCDNDALGYPCYNLYAGGWYYGHWRGDWNGDDRRNSSGGGYVWAFNYWDTYNFYVWLANPYFTDTAALYAYWDGVNYIFIKSINQNTAPSGWSNVGQRYTHALAVFHDNHVTGADFVRGDFSTALKNERLAPEHVIEESGRCRQRSIQDPRIAATQQKMLNAVDHYQDARGSFHITFTNNHQSEDVDFEVSPQDKSSFVRITNADGDVVEHATNGQSTIRLYPGRSAFEKKQLAEASQPEGPRYYHNQKCEPVYVHRQDPAWAVGANEVTLPENYAFWLTTSDSNIVGQDKVLDRDATVIFGRHNAYLRNKLGASTFEMWVDDETGVLLKLVGTDEAGKVVYSIDVQDIRFNSGIELNPAIEAPAGWKNLKSS
ncbi:MAG: hypothetical protein ACREXR_09915, partial [Gammaproteobacteria bacterium]